MKTARWIFYTVMVLCLFGGMINGIRAYYIVLMVQLFVVLIGAALNIWTAASFSYTQTLSQETGVKGDVCRLTVGVHNDKPFPFTAMRIRVQGIGQNTDVTFSLMPHTGTQFTFDVALPYRGAFDVGMTKLTVTDIFGIIPIRFDMRRLSYYRMKHILVYPRASALTRSVSANTDAKQFLPVRAQTATDGESYAGARAYVSGDALKRVHWKLSARKGELMTRQFETPSLGRTLILIDNRTALEGEDALRFSDTVCEYAATLTRHLQKTRQQLQLIPLSTPERSFQPLSLKAALEYLSLLPFEKNAEITSELAVFLEKAEGAESVYVISGTADTEMPGMLLQAVSRGIPVMLIHIKNPGSPDPVLPTSLPHQCFEVGSDASALRI